MPLATGTKLGPYEILAAAGEGGMGEVYRARDTRLDRTVAVKVLSARLGDRPDLQKRLEREARTISKLTHPHICALYDVGQQGGVDFLVMEYLEGETLSHRLVRGPLAIEQTLKYGVEIAAALETAHRQGIIHRDLKPGNVMLTKSGAKLMDFGLAKLVEQPAPVAMALSEMANAPTLPSEEKKLTDEGVVVGTFQYMAPEQLEGKEADARTDLFALGMVLYEMATGRPAFTGRTKASVIAAILSSEPPPISSLQPLAPPAFDRVVRTCLAKDPEERFETAHDVKLALKWVAEGGSQAGLPAPVMARRKRREGWAWTLTALFFLAAALATIGYLQRAPQPGTAVRFEIAAPANTTFEQWILAQVSPHNRRILFGAVDSSGKRTVWLRSLDSFETRRLTGVDNAQFVAWSPDGHTLAFWADGKLQKMDLAGAPPETVCTLQIGRGVGIVGIGLTWGKDDVFLANSPKFGSIVRFSPDNCTPSEATKLDRSRHFAHLWPWFLPDEQHFLYAAVALSKNHEIWAGSLDSTEARLVLRNASFPVYIEPGWLLFDRHGILMAQPFDWKSLKLSGEPTQLVPEQLQFSDLLGAATFSASHDVLIYQLQPWQSSQAYWFDHSGKQLSAATSEPRVFINVRLSPDGKRLVASGYDPQTHLGDLWLYDFTRSAWTRLTASPTPGGKVGVWSPDGARLVYADQGAGGGSDLFVVPASGGKEELLLHSDNAKFLTDWSADGRLVLFWVVTTETGADLWVLDMGSHKARPLIQSPGDQSEGRFSPDGKWFAYTSNDSGQPEVYLQALSGGTRIQASTGGGSEARWRSDGREIYYLSPPGRVMAAGITLGPSLHMGVPHELFALPSGAVGYETARDGRFLVNLRVASSERERIQVVVNWLAELKK